MVRDVCVCVCVCVCVPPQQAVGTRNQKDGFGSAGRTRAAPRASAWRRRQCRRLELSVALVNDAALPISAKFDRNGGEDRHRAATMSSEACASRRRRPRSPSHHRENEGLLFVGASYGEDRAFVAFFFSQSAAAQLCVLLKVQCYLPLKLAIVVRSVKVRRT